jgi:hypothetical protein
MDALAHFSNGTPPPTKGKTKMFMARPQLCQTLNATGLEA